MRDLAYLLLFSVCIACLLIAGCSQPGQSGTDVQPPTHTEQVTPFPTVQQTSGQPQYIVAVTVQTAGKNIIITYQGGQDTDTLLYCTVSVNGVEQSKKLGSTPGDTITLEGAATTSHDRVVIVGHFKDGSSQTVLDSTYQGGSGSAGYWQENPQVIIPYPRPSLIPQTIEKFTVPMTPRVVYTVPRVVTPDISRYREL
jgi:hypothetical protein